MRIDHHATQKTKQTGTDSLAIMFNGIFGGEKTLVIVNH